MTALHPLRLGEKRPEMLGVKATAAAASLIGIVGNSKVGFVQDLPDAFLPVIAILDAFLRRASAVYLQRWSTAVCARRWDSSVPSPRRITQAESGVGGSGPP